MERMKKGNSGRGGGRGAQHRARSTSRGRNAQQRRSRSRGRGGGGNRNRGRSNSRPRYNKRGQWRRFGPNNRGKKFTNGYMMNNMRRSRSNTSLNRSGSRGRSRTRATYPTRRGGKFVARSRSRSRNRMMNYGLPPPAYLQRTNSMPNLSDPGSVHSRLGYQNNAQMAYRKRVNHAKNTLLRSPNKNFRMQHALSVRLILLDILLV